MRERVRKNAGSVYPDGPPFTLLIDIKAEAEATYAQLREVLGGYREMLTVFRPGNTVRGAVTVILSGDRPWKPVEAEPESLAGLDGRVADLDKNWSAHLVPLISDNWRLHFQWNGEGLFPEAERTKLESMVKRAHEQGRRIRFWAAADRPEMWSVQRQAGVDLLNTDRLADLAAFLRSKAD